MKKEALFINRMNKGFLILLLGFYSITWSLNSIAQSSQMSEQGEWDKRLGLAKKEGRVVVSITTSAELRVAIEKHFEKRFGIDVEPVVGRAPNVIRKISENPRAVFATSMFTSAAASRSSPGCSRKESLKRSSR